MAPSPEALILVVDDSPVYRKLVETALAEKEYRVLLANSGRQALKLVSKHRPEIVITDWEMPDVTGIELCGHIRRDHDSFTYIVLLTSHTEKEQVIKGLAAGADDYLTKPFHSGELLARIAVGLRIVELHRQIQAKNRQLEELALTDSLTGLPNRRAIAIWAERELQAAVRHCFSFWVVMVDLDHFKRINDNCGHDAGDQVLKKFSELLKANTRASNICGRVGGEEFLIALTHVDKTDVHIAIDRIRREVETERFMFGQQAWQVTASFGISGLRSNQATDFDQLLREADAALYAAKDNGRNRLEFGEGY
jgi:two-component system, cell cycle response regulator